MSGELNGKVALITGATRGLGRKMASTLAAAGADIVVVSRKADACQATAAELESEFPVRAFAHPCHVGDWDAIDRLVGDVYAEIGHIDVLINNAGISPTYPRLSDVTEALFDKTVAVNMKGPFRLTTLVGERMAQGDGGSIINVSSTGAVSPRPQYAPYAAAKAGLNTLTIAFAQAFGPTVRVNALMCGPFETDISANWDPDEVERMLDRFALGRVGRPDEIGGTVLYLATDASSFTTGTILAVHGGEQ